MPPNSCLVFEDTEMGIQAATAAGMASVKSPPALGKKEQDHLTRGLIEEDHVGPDALVRAGEQARQGLIS